MAALRKLYNTLEQVLLRQAVFFNFFDKAYFVLKVFVALTN